MRLALPVSPVGTGRDGGARAARRGRPRRHRRGPGRSWSVAAAGVTGSAMSEPVSPVAFRSPVGRLRLAKGRTTVVSGSASRSAVGTRLGEGRQQCILVLLGSVRGGPPDPNTIERPERAEPVTAGIRPPVAELGRGHRRHPPGDGALARADEEDGLRRKPERGESGRERFRERPLTVETKRLHALDPLPDAGQLDRRGRKRGGKLDDEDALALRRDRPTPDRGTVRHQPDRAEQAGGVRGRRHRSMVQVGGSGYRPRR